MRERTADVLIVGGGTGGVAAALAALRLRRKVIMTEETDWIGGQLTAQAVPPDEHPWIDTTGCTRSYCVFREKVREYYWRNYPMTEDARQDRRLNPGAGNVSRLCHEPRIALAVLEEMIAPYRSAGRLEVLSRHRPVAAETDGDRVSAVTLVNDKTDEQVVIHAPYILDATELGDLLELANVEHGIGAESQGQTGEQHAVTGDPQPLDQQAITWCFAMDYLPGENHTIDKPQDYDFWKGYQADFWPGPQLGWRDVHPITLETRDRGVFHGPQKGSEGSFWLYRRILFTGFYPAGYMPSDITLVNWPQIDYWLGPLVGVNEEQKAEHLRQCRQLSFSLLYWMQTEAPRHDGQGYGYPGLRLRTDIVGTSDGLAKYVYVREARCMLTEFIVCEERVGVEQRRQMGAPVGAALFEDTVGVGSYRIDLHPSTAPRTYVDISSYPFQIPLGSLIPVRLENLLPACKNLGVTHITNGCYRLHPVEWNFGEAAGALAAYCLEQQTTPRQVLRDAARLSDFQNMLVNTLGFELKWPEYARITAR